MSSARHEETNAVIEQMSADDWQTIKQIRLRALSDAPTAFGSSFEEQSKQTDTQWIERVRQLTDTNAGTWLAWIEDNPVGMVVGSPDTDEPNKAWLVSMWVAPEARKQSVGKQLVQHVIDWAKRSNYQTLSLDVTGGNDPARILYERCGFRLTGSTMPHPRYDHLVEHEMQLLLT